MSLFHSKLTISFPSAFWFEVARVSRPCDGEEVESGVDFVTACVRSIKVFDFHAGATSIGMLALFLVSGHVYSPSIRGSASSTFFFFVGRSVLY